MKMSGRILRALAGFLPVMSLVGLVPMGAPLAVTGMTPAPGSVLTTPPLEVLITLNGPPDSLTVNATSVVVSRASTDGVLGTADDVVVAPITISLVGSNEIQADLASALLPNDLYQVRIRGNEVPIPGMVSYWKLDEGSGTTTADSSGGGVTGAISGASWTTGRLGNALDFNGLDNRVVLSASDVPVPWTAAMWVRRQDSPYADSRLTDNLGPVGTSLRLEQYNNTNKAGFTQGGVADYVLDYTVSVGPWSHLTFVGQASGTSLYANGLPVAAHGTSISLSRGCLGSQGFNSLLGTLDDVRIYNRVLTGSEILALARLGGTVRDAGGSPLDGEFGGSFHSGNGSPGGDFTATFTLSSPDPLVLEAPSGLTARPVVGVPIRLAWTDNSTSEEGFRVERGTDGIVFTEIGSAGANATEFDDNGAPGPGPYFYRVRAYNATGASRYSNMASASLAGSPSVVSITHRCGLLGLELAIPIGLLTAWHLWRRRRRPRRSVDNAGRWDPT